MIDPKPGDEHKYVTYIAHDGHREAGLISSWNEHYVFVRYSTGDTAAATERCDLHWGLVGNVRNRHSGYWEMHPEE